MTSVTLRALRRADEADWQRLWTGYLAHYGTRLPEATFADTFERLLSDDPWQPHGLVAFDGEAAVGLVHYLFHSHCWRPERSVYLQDLFVAPGTRGRGVGRALIEAVFEAADREGSPHVYWLTKADNATARLLYDRIADDSGFVVYRRATG